MSPHARAIRPTPLRSLTAALVAACVACAGSEANPARVEPKLEGRMTLRPRHDVAMGVHGPMFGLGDCDGDGDLDVALPNGTILRRSADGSFAPPERVAELPLFADLQDVDGDGVLDLLTASPFLELRKGIGDCRFDAPVISKDTPCGGGSLVALTPTDADLDGVRDEYAVCGGSSPPVSFLRGLGDGRFERVELPNYAVANPQSWGVPVFSFFSADVDGDGVPDGSLLSDAGTGWFGWGVAGDPAAFARDEALTKLTMGRNTMGFTSLDYDRDGKLDWFWSGNGFGNALLQHRGGRVLVDRAAAAGVASARQSGVGDYFQTWSAMAFDADLDGWSDLLSLRLRTEQDAGANELAAMPNLFVNRHDGTFADVAATHVSGPIHAYQAACGDLAGNGRAGCVLAEFEGLSVLENELVPAGGWAGIRLQGTVSDPEGLGAIVDVEGATPPQRHLVLAAPATYAHHVPALLLPTGSAASLDLVVRWPSGITQNVRNVPAGEYTTIVEPAVVTLTRRVVPADGQSAVVVSVSGALAGASAVALEATGDARWQGEAVTSDGILRRTLVAPTTAGEVVLTIRLDGRPMAVHPRVRFR